MSRIEDVRHMVSDDNTSISDIKLAAGKFCEAREWGQYHNAKELSISAVIESSELLELFRFKTEREMTDMLNDPCSREKVSDELADVLFAVSRFAQLYDIDLATSFYDKMAKNEQKYPVDKARGSSKKYDEL